MKIVPGIQWLRFEAVSPTNLGSDYGSAPVDRPTVRDVWLELPYLPDSVLKGVLAGRLGDVDEKHPERSARRERYYGSPDRPETDEHGLEWGRPGSVVFGNGELVAFPVPTRDGVRAWVIPAPILGRLLHLDGGGDTDALGLLARIDQGEPNAVGWPAPVSLDAGIDPDWLHEHSVTARWPALAPHLHRFVGWPPATAEPLIVASGPLARRLWTEAAELRTLTALERTTKTANAGTLRTVELIPQGTVFVALVTSGGPDEGPELPKRIQVGAWESLGLGFMAVSRIEPIGERDAPPPSAGAPAPVPAEDVDVMAAMHVALGEIRPEEQRDLAAALRSAIFNFGPRAQFSGIEAAVAFSLAKAKPAAAEPKAEAQAHRWLLRTLLNLTAQADESVGASRALLSWLETDPFRPGTLHAHRATILARWRWLRRFAELGLAPPPREEDP